LETDKAIEVTGTRFGDEPDPAQAVGLQAFKERLENNLSDPLFPAGAEDSQILDIGITDAVTDCPSHPYDLVSLCDNHETVTARDQPRDQLLSDFIGWVPPPLRSVELDDLPDLLFGGRLEKNALYRAVIT
jgi:hypothetical protein